MQALRPLLRALALLLGLGVAALTPAAAGDPEAAFAKLATDSYSDVEAGIVALVASGAKTAPAALDALADGRLFVRAADKAVVIKTADGKLLDARTGAEFAGEAADLKPIRLNNRVRRALDAARGSLTLLSPDPGKRLAAAEAVFKGRDTAALPALATAIQAETDPRIRRVMQEAQAAALLAAPEGTDLDKVTAIEVLSQRGDQDALALLRMQVAQGSPTVKSAAETAAAAIERRLALLANVQNAWYGLSLASVLLLAAIGLAITFGQMGVINMAHGEMVMLGAYTTFVVQEVIRTRAPGLFDASLFIAIPLAFLVAGAVGIAIERGIIRHLYGRPLETLLATWGLSLILQQAVRTIFGPTNKQVGNPQWMSGSFELGGLDITYN
ncbi:MAG TPA: urea ABC transporter permease subunit UrtB, partial [Beijerinckiaceae bacterium]|nr:urea ABC transporter permease subunit UrtB [Beijerinckiaceae bacterium]